jgi:biopolymer transport protein ExbD
MKKQKRSAPKSAVGKPDSAAVKIDLTPMIDVTFLLMVFFLLGTRFKAPEGKLDAHMPNDRGVSEAIPLEFEEELTIRILMPPDNTGPVYRLGSVDLPTLDALERRMRRLFSPERPVTIDSAPAATYGCVTQVLNACVKVGYANIAFAAPSSHSPGRRPDQM